MEKFSKNLKDRAVKIINYKNKKIIPLTTEAHESYEDQGRCYIQRNFLRYQR